MTTAQQFRNAQSEFNNQVAEVRAAMNVDSQGTANLSRLLTTLSDAPDIFIRLPREKQDSILRLAGIGMAYCCCGAIESQLMERGEL